MIGNIRIYVLINAYLLGFLGRFPKKTIFGLDQHIRLELKFSYIQN